MKRPIFLPLSNGNEGIVLAKSEDEAKEIVLEKGAIGERIGNGIYQYDLKEFLAALMEEENGSKDA
jgi:hypothetical protein